MATPSELNSELADVLSLNDHMTQVADAHIPLQIDFWTTASPSQLEHLNSSIALQASRGTNVPQALASQSDTYRTTLQAYQDSSGSLASLEWSYQLAFQHQLNLRTWRYAFGHLLTLYLLAGATLFIWLPQYTKLIQSIYKTSNVASGPAFASLLFINTHYYNILGLYFITLVLIVLAPWLVARWTSRFFLRTPHAEYARTILALSRMFANCFRQRFTNTESLCLHGNTQALDLSLLQWASQQADQYKPNSSTNFEPSVNAYRAVEQLMNRRVASIEASHRRRYPIIGRIIPGAMLVLLLGTLLFWPMVELLITICLP